MCTVRKLSIPRLSGRTWRTLCQVARGTEAPIQFSNGLAGKNHLGRSGPSFWPAAASERKRTHGHDRGLSLLRRWGGRPGLQMRRHRLQRSAHLCQLGEVGLAWQHEHLRTRNHAHIPLLKSSRQ